MAAQNESAAGWSPAALEPTSRLADKLPSSNHPAERPASLHSAPSVLTEAATPARVRIAVLRPSGEVLSLTGQQATVALALIAAGQHGVSQLDVLPWCWDLASPIRDLRAVLGRDTILKRPGDRRQRQPCRYWLTEAVTVAAPVQTAGGQP